MTQTDLRLEAVQPRRCVEIKGPHMTTLGMLLWDKVTLDVELVLQLFIQLCDTLKDTHKHGYAAGFLHPEGIIVVMSGDNLKSVHIKKPGVHCDVAYTDEISLSMDKRIYQSPEQLLYGLLPSPRSDVYTLGMIMHTALAGAPPVDDQKKSIRLVTARCGGKLETVAEHKIAFLENVIRKCLKEEETDRYASVMDLRIDLARIKRGIAPEKGSRKGLSLGSRKLFWAAAASIILFFSMASFHSIMGQISPMIESSWNKSPDDYEVGDPFSITLKARQKCFAYIFYINETDESMSLYPSRYQGNNIVGIEKPVFIDNVENHLMKVDSSHGRLLLVSIADGAGGRQIKRQLLKDEDWSDKWPTDHCLTISGSQLLDRLVSLRSKHPDLIYYSMENAPRAKEARKERLKFTKPAKIEITFFSTEPLFKFIQE